MLKTRKEMWLKRFEGKTTDGYIGQCACCANYMYDDCESYEDESDNMFCSVECVLTHYGIKHNE